MFWQSEAVAAAGGDAVPDLLALGRRVRHLRQERGLTLASLAGLVGRAPSQLSLIENGRREPRLAVLQAIAGALEVPLTALLEPEPPSRRAALEIALERAQRGPVYAALGLPPVRVSSRTPNDALRALVGLHDELIRRLGQSAATPEEARRANIELRRVMREQNNYFPDIEQAANSLLEAVGRQSGPLTRTALSAMATHLGFSLHHVDDLPESTRSLADLRNRRLYLHRTTPRSGHDPHYVALQALGHIVLGHHPPGGYADFLRQRVETNYFAAAVLVPERATLDLLRGAVRERSVAIEDLRDAYAVSYETAAHRFTNLATQHLGLAVHFSRIDRTGTIYKAYENDGVVFPTDVTGAIEGQQACRSWAARAAFASTDRGSPYFQYTDTPGGTYWCCTQVEGSPGAEYSVTVGVRFADVGRLRGRDTHIRTVSRCPDQSCCRTPPKHLADQWAGHAWPSARVHSHLLAALPPGTFPGVDDTEVYQFLQSKTPP